MAEAIATLQEAVKNAAVEAAKEEVVDKEAGDGEALAEADVETIVREAVTQGELWQWRTQGHGGVLLDNLDPPCLLEKLYTVEQACSTALRS